MPFFQSASGSVTINASMTPVNQPLVNWHGELGDYHSAVSGGLQVEQEIPELLQASCPDAFHDSQARFPPPRCAPGTRTETLDQVSDWMNAGDEQILWISGPSGIEQSTIAQTVADICADRSILAGSFFFLRTSPGRDTPECLIPSIALQLRMNIPHNHRLLEDIIKKDPSIFRKDTRTQTENLIRPIFATTSPQTSRRLFLIIDGLDECRGEMEVLQAVKGLAIACEPLSILVTSRHAPPTGMAFDYFHIEVGAYDYRRRGNNPIIVHGKVGMPTRPRRRGPSPQPPINLSEELKTCQGRPQRYERFRTPVLPKKMPGDAADIKSNHNLPHPDNLAITASKPKLNTSNRVHSPLFGPEQEGTQHPKFLSYLSRGLTADLAFNCITVKEECLLNTLTRYGWEGSYLVQVGFNAERLHLGQGILQEIYIFLGSELDPAVFQQLAAILDPFPVTVYTPEECHHGAPSPPENESVWNLWSSHGIYQKGIKSQVAVPVDGESSGKSVGKGTFSQTSNNSGGSSSKGDNGSDRAGNGPPKKAGDSDHDGTGGNAGESPDMSVIAARPGTREVVIPFSSTLTYTDRPRLSSQFTTNACVEIKIEDNHQSQSRPAGSAWGGPWFEVKMTQLDADMRTLPAGKPEYHLDFSQIRFIASRSPSDVLNYTPLIIRSEEDNVKSKSERNTSKGIQTVIGANPAVHLNATRSTISGEERTQKRWGVVGHYLASDKNDYTEAAQTTMVWKYTHNTAFYTCESQNKFEIRPAATFVLSGTSETVPCLEVEVVMCYSWFSQPRSFKFRDWLADLSKPKDKPPAFFNFLHQATIDIDLEKVKSGAEWVSRLTADEQRTAAELGKPDKSKALVRRLENGKGTADCQVSLQAALHGRIDLTEEQKKNARPLLDSLRRESPNLHEGGGESMSTGLPTPSASPDPNSSLPFISSTSSAGALRADDDMGVD